MLQPAPACQNCRKPARPAARWRRVLAGVLPLLAAFLIPNSPATLADEPPLLPVLARVGPWPSASNMIVFRDRLWFANARLGVNHNSAEIHSLDLATGAARHERHLWSQAAGQPAVHAGLLYWPGEDPRLHGDWGAFQATNGTDWGWGLIPGGGIFHVHALAEAQGRLVGAVSAWKAGLAVSRDRGITWQRIYTHPTPDRRVSRITDLYPLGDNLVGDLRAPEGRRLVRLLGDSVTSLPGWPQGRRYSNLGQFRGALYGFVHNDAGTALWRSDTASSQEVLAARGDWRPWALAAHDGSLWAVERHADGGTVWRSRDAEAWEPAWRLAGGFPRQILATPAGLFVAGDGDDGHGLIWGQIASQRAPPPSPEALPQFQAGLAPALNAPALHASARVDPAPNASTPGLADIGAALDEVLADAASYDRIGWNIRRAVADAVRAGPPATFFSRRLARPRPDGAVTPFGDVVIPDRGSIGAFWLIWGMALAGEGRVPPRYIAAPWSVPPNSAEKYFEPQLMAIWAVSVLGQRDRATLDALIARVANAEDPLWLRLDAAGALSSLVETGHGTDLAAWSKWWLDARPTWPVRQP